MTTQMSGIIPLEILERVRDRGTLFQLLKEQLGWPVYDEEDTFTYDYPDLAGSIAAHAWISQIVPFSGNDPFLLILAEFQTPFRRADLREILRNIRRKMKHEAAYQGKGLEDIIFVCATDDYQGIRLAHFKEVEGRQPKLSVFGWERDRITETRTLREVNLPALRLQGNLYKEPVWDADTRKRWHDAWDVDSVTDKFFGEFHETFNHKEKPSVLGLIKQASPGVSAEDLHAFTLTLMNRLLFCWFIQQKKWLNHDTAYLTRQWTSLRITHGNHTADQRARADDSFYRDYLRPLFLHMLNTPPDAREVAFTERLGDIPYLNGGLFAENNLDRLANPANTARKIIVPNAAIALLLSERPDIDRRPEGLFLRWHFTIEESMPDDVDVAVDPEMLGKVFEELMNEVTSASGDTRRHETGAYYTPRPVVSFMCREGLKGYLGCDDAITKFVDEYDASLLGNPEQVLAKLQTVRACDPACGSGAYLLGMLQELIRLRRALFVTRQVDPRNDYERKLEIIQNNLYGVDLEQSAVDIASLRLWLSLAVDNPEKDPLKVQPLPNLDFKIERDDSLTAPNPQGGESSHLFRYAAIARFAQVKREFVRCSDVEQKKALLGEANTLRTELRQNVHGNTPVTGFDWAVEFVEVFQGEREDGSDGGGFDIVLANPPYVRQELIRDQKPKLREIYGDLYCGTADLYIFFYYRALQLLKRDGMLVFISSNKWLRANYGAKLKAHIANTAMVGSIIDFGDLPVFQTALAYPMIIIAKKGTRQSTTIFTEVTSLDDPYPDVRMLIDQQGYSLPYNAITGENWRLTKADSANRLSIMEASGKPLGEYVERRFYRGIVTGCNNVFFIDRTTRDELIRQDPRSAEIIKPLAVGEDISKWRIDRRDRWIIFTRRGIDINLYPAIQAYLSRYRDRLEPKPRDWPSDQAWGGRKQGGYKWYEIQDDIAYHAEFTKPKIVYQEIATYQSFSFDRDELYVNNKVFIIPVDDLYLLGVLNSNLAWYYLDETCSKLQGGAFAMQSPYISKLPIPNATNAERATIAGLVQKCLDARGVGCEAWETEINERVTRLYGV